MRAEQVAIIYTSYLPIADCSKKLLISLWKSAAGMNSAIEEVSGKKYEFEPIMKGIQLDCAFANSGLKFTEGIHAFEELYYLNLVAFDTMDKNYCNLYFKNLLKFVRDEIKSSDALRFQSAAKTDVMAISRALNLMDKEF